MAVIYEWDIETVDKHDDILDHDHSTKLEGLKRHWERGTDVEGCTIRLVLVRDIWGPWEGEPDATLEHRAWAYVNGVLPAEFDDSVAVPVRFEAELRRWAHIFGTGTKA